MKNNFSSASPSRRNSVEKEMVEKVEKDVPDLEVTETKDEEIVTEEVEKEEAVSLEDDLSEDVNEEKSDFDIIDQKVDDKDALKDDVGDDWGLVINKAEIDQDVSAAEAMEVEESENKSDQIERKVGAEENDT